MALSNAPNAGSNGSRSSPAGDAGPRGGIMPVRPTPGPAPMKTEILSIGSELTSGQNLDTNSQWLSRRLAEIGVPVGWHTTIADDLDANIDAFRIAANRAELVLITGGLGPTQ